MGDSNPEGELTPAEYAAELDRVLAAIDRLDQAPSENTTLLHSLPLVWRVRGDQQEFQISTESLRHDLLDNSENPTPEKTAAIRQRVQSLRADLNAYQEPAPDSSSQHALVSQILSRPEFSDVHKGLSWTDRLKQQLAMLLIRALERVFRSSAVPEVGKVLIYCLIGLAVLALAYWAYKSIRSDATLERVIPDTEVISAKEWTVWMAEAREAAGRGDWREAIHLAYWAGISFLEGQGTWRPDRARTPREYLRLMPPSSERHPTLAALTRSFEIVWYGKRDADSRAFAQTLEALEKLGCRPS